MGLITNYNLRSMIVRKGTAAMTAMGIAMVVAVFVMTMAIAQGFRGALVASGSNENAILLRKGATSETVSAVLRPQLPLIEAHAAGGARRRRPRAGLARAGRDHLAAAGVGQQAGQRAAARRRPARVRDPQHADSSSRGAA